MQRCYQNKMHGLYFLCFLSVFLPLLGGCGQRHRARTDRLNHSEKKTHVWRQNGRTKTQTALTLKLHTWTDSSSGCVGLVACGGDEEPLTGTESKGALHMAAVDGLEAKPMKNVTAGGVLSRRSKNRKGVNSEIVLKLLVFSLSVAMFWMLTHRGGTNEWGWRANVRGCAIVTTKMSALGNEMVWVYFDNSFIILWTARLKTWPRNTKTDLLRVWVSDTCFLSIWTFLCLLL